MELDFSQQVQNSEKLQKAFSSQKESRLLSQLSDSDFAYIAKGGSKDSGGRTLPRSLRQFPVYNKVRVERALEDLNSSSLCSEATAEAFRKIKAQAKRFGVKVSEEIEGAERFDGKKRSELPDSAFLDPKRRSFPVVSCKNVKAAVSTWGMYKGSMSFDEFKSKLKSRAKKLGCEGSLPATWKSDSKAKDWEKTDEKELKRDTKKEKKEHHKDAVEDDESKLKKLKKEKPSEKKSVETHDLKKDIKYDKKKEAEAASDKQKAAKEKFLEMIRKKKGGDKKDDDKDDDKEGDKKSDDKKDSKKKEESKAQGIAPLNNIDFQEQLRVKDPQQLVKTVGDDEEEDKKELQQDDKKEKKEHERDAIKDDKKQVKDLKKDEKEDEKSLKKATAPAGCPECYR